MVPGDLLVLGLNGRVSALLRKNGHVLWSTKLPGVFGHRFVTITCDESHVYACIQGQLHCLDMETGRVLWYNELKGFGYGIATICLPGSDVDNVPAAHAMMETTQRKQTSSD